ncbi:hypothetical protein C8R46DRAFT_1283838 [Mycena filopes]|nr:hypothetical protein C8R46DRAFT_1283838 [Mycena filopes]
MSKLQNLENSPLALAPAPGTAALPLKVDVQDISGCTRGSRAQNQGNDCVLAPFHAPVCALRVPVPVPSRSPETHTPPSGVSGPNVLGSNAVERLVPTAGSPGTCCLWADPCSRFPLQDGVAGAWRPADAKGIYDKGMSPAGPLLGIAGIGGDSARAGAAGPEPEFRAPTHGPLTAARFNGLLSVSSRVTILTTREDDEEECQGTVEDASFLAEYALIGSAPDQGLTSSGRLYVDGHDLGAAVARQGPHNSTHPDSHEIKFALTYLQVNIASNSESEIPAAAKILRIGQSMIPMASPKAILLPPATQAATY